MAGIVYGRLEGPPAGYALYFSAFIVLLSAVLLFSFLRARKAAPSVIVIVLFFVAGIVHINKVSEPASPSHLYHLISRPADVTLAGTIRSVTAVARDKSRLLLSAEEVLLERNSPAGTSGLVLLNMDFPIPPEFTPGKKVLIRADISRVRRNGTPGAFDYRQFLADRNIHVIGRVRSPAAIALTLGESPPDTLLDSSAIFFQQNRNRIIRFIQSSELNDTAKGLYAAILTGQRDWLSTDILQNFRKAGTFHLLAISGMHMVLLFLASTFLISLLLKSSTGLMLRYPIWKIAAGLSIFPLLYYTALSGANPPSVRAFIMTAILIAAVVTDRKNSIFNSICFASLAILTLDPTALFSVSFQLSFTAVAGIVILINRFPLIPATADQGNKIHSILHWTKSSIFISAAAIVVTAPLTLYYFQQVSFAGPITTLLAAPAICFISLPLGLLASLTHQIFPAFATLLLNCGAIGLVFSAQVSQLGAAIPYASIKLAPPAIIQIIGYYFFLFSMLRVNRSPKTFILPVILLFALLLQPLLTSKLAPLNNFPSISFLDVGKGNATLVQLPGAINILIDGGTSGTDDFNVGERVIAPFLWHQKIRKLDAIVITHAHSDHFNGLDHIVSYFKPETLWVNGSESNDPRYGRILALARKHGVTVKIPVDGELIEESLGNRVFCLKNLHRRQPEDVSENSRSLVLKITGSGRSVILPGDLMEGDGRQYLADEPAGVDLLLAPHHGSESSATRELAEMLQPEFTIVSGGGSSNDDSFETEEALQLYGTEIFNVRDQGTITCTIGREKLECTPVSAKGADR